MIKETYWAVRIGIHGKHTPYFMVHPDSHTSPALFTDRADAKRAALRQRIKQSHYRIVRVEVRELRVRAEALNVKGDRQ